MIWHHYGLSNTVLKTNDPLTLWKADRGSVEIGKGTLAGYLPAKRAVRIQVQVIPAIRSIPDRQGGSLNVCGQPL